MSCQNITGPAQCYHPRTIRQNLQALAVHGLHSDIGFNLIGVGVKLYPVGAKTYSVTGRANVYE